jgi:two-component sensor histidine kinase
MDKELSAVDIKDYLENLSASLAGSFGYRREQIETNVNMSQTTMDIDMAIPIGLIVNELVTNSFKHAFDSMEKGKIKVSLTGNDDGIIELKVADNGKGHLAGAEQSGSFGMKLVTTLVEQLNATMHQEQDNGTIYNIRIRA